MILLLDGPSGSGKTTVANQWHHVLGWPVLHLEDMYPGWYGLSAGSALVASSVLNPALAPAQRGYWRWDWYTSTFAEWSPTPDGGEGRSLIIEGCGALTAENLAVARCLGDGEAWGVWLELDAPERYRRAMARDDSFTTHWDMWAEQEQAHYRRHRPWSLAHWRINRAHFG